MMRLLKQLMIIFSIVVMLDGVEEICYASSYSTTDKILENSTYELLTEDDVEGLTKEELQTAINEIYAVYGRKFTDPAVQNYFNSKSWYYGYIEPDQFDPSVFGDIERKNIDFLSAYMNNMAASESKKNSQNNMTKNTSNQTQNKLYRENIRNKDSLLEYIKNHNIDLGDSVQKLKKIEGKIEGNAVPVNLKLNSKFFGKKYYSLTNDTTDIGYVGDLKDNKPDGLGFIVEYESDLSTSELVYRIRYMGEFREGRYDGSGILYYTEELSDSEKTLINNSEYPQKIVDNISNPIKYIGEFKNGKPDGQGVSFENYCMIEFLLECIDPVNNIIDLSDYYELNTEYAGDREIENIIDNFSNVTINVGEFKDGQADGKIKTYNYGYLLYDGEMKRGSLDGKGKVYYEKSNQIAYEGELMDGMRHGQGTAYDESGNVQYSGKWDHDDYES